MDEPPLPTSPRGDYFAGAVNGRNNALRECANALETALAASGSDDAPQPILKHCDNEGCVCRDPKQFVVVGTEPTREQIAQAIYRSEWGPNSYVREEPSKMQAPWDSLAEGYYQDYLRDADAVLALFRAPSEVKP